MRRLVWLAIASIGASLVVMAQDVTIKLQQGERPAMAIPDFRGAGDAQSFMDAFNQTLWADVDGAGLFKMVPKTMYPSAVPQQPSDFRQPPPVVERTPVRGRQQLSQPQTGGGWWMSDWSGPPASANYLAFGYTAVQNGVFVLRGWLFDLSRGAPDSAQVVGNTYLGTVDEAGARKVAHEFAADIIARFGGKTLFGTRLYFVSNRTGHKEVWVMDQDGKNQRQLTRFNSTSIQPTASPDGSKIALLATRASILLYLSFRWIRCGICGSITSAHRSMRRLSLRPTGNRWCMPRRRRTTGVAGSTLRIWTGADCDQSRRRASLMSNLR